jgi:hypothetical protein
LYKGPALRFSFYQTFTVPLQIPISGHSQAFPLEDFVFVDNYDKNGKSSARTRGDKVYILFLWITFAVSVIHIFTQVMHPLYSLLSQSIKVHG